VKPILPIALVATVLIVGCSDNGESETSAAPKIRPAKLVTVEASSNQRDLSFPAIIQAAQTAELTFQTSGEIREINVLEGDPVTAGTVVAKLDQRDALNRLAQVQAEFDNAKTEFERAERLAIEDAIARSELETRKTRLDVTQADLSVRHQSIWNRRVDKLSECLAHLGFHFRQRLCGVASAVV